MLLTNDKPLTKDNADLGMQLLIQLFNVSDVFVRLCVERCKKLDLTNRQFYNLMTNFVFLNTGYPTLANFFNEKNKPEPAWMK